MWKVSVGGDDSIFASRQVVGFLKDFELVWQNCACE